MLHCLLELARKSLNGTIIAPHGSPNVTLNTDVTPARGLLYRLVYDAHATCIICPIYTIP